MVRSEPGYREKSVNLEAGHPFVDAAIAKLLKNIEVARSEGVRVLTVIHGYGSSGKGGKIRVESRKLLDFLITEKKIQGYIPGEEFQKRAGAVKQLLHQFPQLAHHEHLNRGNPGITIVVL